MSTEITTALRERHWSDARRLLSHLRTAQEVVEPPALQTWVGECNKASLSLEKGRNEVTIEEYDSQSRDIWRTLESILRVVDGSTQDDLIEETGVIRRKPVWGIGERHGGTIFADWKAGKLFKKDEALNAIQAFSVLHTEVSRKSDSSRPLYTGSITFEYPPGQVIQGSSPFHPSVVFLANVASTQTCRSIITAASAIAFTPDRAAYAITSAHEQASVPTHSFYWVADTSFMNNLFERVRPYLPQTWSDGSRLYGLNMRLRCYLYPGTEYPPHIDGVWSPSGIDEQTGRYISNASPAGLIVMSRLTLLLYLNDDFVSGETTFFLPRKDEQGLEEWPVGPRCGGVLIFPQGGEGLLHEGRSVSKGGKFLVRTDVMYAATR